MEKKLYSISGMKFGYVFPEDSPAVFGARTIKDPHHLGFLWDRTCYYGEEKAVKALETLLNKGGLLEIIKARTDHMIRLYLFDGSQAEEHVVYENWFVKVLANTNASHGYVYLSAFLKPVNLDTAYQSDEKETGEKYGEYIDGSKSPQMFRRRKDHRLVWTGQRLPEIGEKVYVKHPGEEVEVCWYGSESGYLFCLFVRPGCGDMLQWAKADYEDEAKFKWLCAGKDAKGWKTKFRKAEQRRERLFDSGFDPDDTTRWSHEMKLGGVPILTLYEGLIDDKRFPRMPLSNFMGQEWEEIETKQEVGAAK